MDRLYRMVPPFLGARPFSAWQIELTTRCPLSCRMCIRDTAEDWHGGDMDIGDFKGLLPYLKYVDTVVLEGWGESMLHGDLMEAVRLVKGSGSGAGFVTCGKGLNRDYMAGLMAAGVDFIGFSISGASPGTHERIRVNSDFRAVIEGIGALNELKRRGGLERPRLHIVYLMVRDNIEDVPSLLGIASGIGIEEVVLVNLIHVTNEWQERQRVFTCEGEPEFEGILKEAEIKAGELKIALRRPSLSPVDVAVCEENPLGNLYISVDGEVSPCVFLYPPTGSPFKRIFCGREHALHKVSFGNVFREPFKAIWDGAGYAAFRERFLQRKRRLGHRPFAFLRGGKAPEPPEPCRSCHKMLGV
jgi:MoaA/NifB/PqqE/SkfB family radical SAM enzyme